MQMFILSIHIESIMGGKKKSNRQTPKGKMFSDEWVKHNSWMGDENELAAKNEEYKRLVGQCKTKVRMPTFEQFMDNPPAMINFVKNQPIFEEDHPPMFLNNQEPIPVPKIRKEVNLYKEWKKEYGALKYRRHNHADPLVIYLLGLATLIIKPLD